MRTPAVFEAPFASSPIQWVRSSINSPLIAGQYLFNPVKIPFTPDFRISPNKLYFLHIFDFSLDISEIDFQSGVSSPLRLNIYYEKPVATPFFRGDILVSKYYSNYGILQYMRATQETQILISLSGTILQTPTIMNKTSLTANITFTVYEISDYVAIQQYLQSWTT